MHSRRWAVVVAVLALTGLAAPGATAATRTAAPPIGRRRLQRHRVVPRPG